MVPLSMADMGPPNAANKLVYYDVPQQSAGENGEPLLSRGGDFFWLEYCQIPGRFYLLANHQPLFLFTLRRG
jgi:hypothetical protein